MKVQLVLESAFCAHVVAMVLLCTNTSFGPSDFKFSSLFSLVCDTLNILLESKPVTSVKSLEDVAAYSSQFRKWFQSLLGLPDV